MFPKANNVRRSDRRARSSTICRRRLLMCYEQNSSRKNKKIQYNWIWRRTRLRGRMTCATPTLTKHTWKKPTQYNNHFFDYSCFDDTILTAPNHQRRSIRIVPQLGSTSTNNNHHNHELYKRLEHRQDPKLGWGCVSKVFEVIVYGVRVRIRTKKQWLRFILDVGRESFCVSRLSVLSIVVQVHLIFSCIDLLLAHFYLWNAVNATSCHTKSQSSITNNATQNNIVRCIQ